MKYEEVMEKCINKLKEDWNQAKKLDKNNFNMDVCKSKYIQYKPYITDVGTMQEVLSECNKETSFDNGYIQVTTEIKTDVDGYCDSDGSIEVDNVDVFLESVGIRPKTKEEFNDMLDNEFQMKRIFVDYIRDIIINKANEMKLDARKFSRYNIQCSLVKLYQEGILDLEGLTKAVYTNC